MSLTAGSGLLLVSWLPAACTGHPAARGVGRVCVSIPAPLAVDRRAACSAGAGFLAAAATAAAGARSQPAFAALDPAFERMATEAPAPREGESAFIELPSGVKYKVLKAGPGAGDAVAPGRGVSVEMTASALNLNGVRFFSTKRADGTPDPLSWTVGDGRAVPGLEQGMQGMHKGEVRRIIVPARLGYGAPGKGKDTGGYQPQPRSFIDQKALDSILKNPNRDASVLFDVRVDRIR